MGHILNIEGKIAMHSVILSTSLKCFFFYMRMIFHWKPNANQCSKKIDATELDKNKVR